MHGLLSLPHLRASGPPITTPGGHCHFLTGAETEPGAVAAAVRGRAERGVDVIKVMTSGGNITAGSLPWQSQFDEDSLRRLVEEAHGVGLPVAAHAHAAEALRTCVTVGVDAVEPAGIGPGKPHDVMPYAVIQFANATEDPLGALRAATSRAADALGLAKTCGRLAPGLVADVLVVRGEVTVDLGALLQVDAVYREGQLVAGPSARPAATA